MTPSLECKYAPGNLRLEDNTVTFGSGGLKSGTLIVRRSSKHGLEPLRLPGGSSLSLSSNIE
jgi:hypothetical protein